MRLHHVLADVFCFKVDIITLCSNQYMNCYVKEKPRPEETSANNVKPPDLGYKIFLYNFTLADIN